MSEKKIACRTMIDEYYRAVDAEDLEGLLDCFTPEATYLRPGYEPLEGRDKLRYFYLNERIIESGAHEITSLIFQEDAEGTITSASRGRFQGKLLGGKPADFRFADFFTHAPDGRIAHRETFFFTSLA